MTLAFNLASILIMSAIIVALILYFQIFSIYFIIPSIVVVVFLLVNIVLLCFIHSYSVRYTSEVSNSNGKYCYDRTTAHIKKTSVASLKPAKSASQIHIEMKSDGLSYKECRPTLKPTLTELAAMISASTVSEGTKNLKEMDDMRRLTIEKSESLPNPTLKNIIQVKKRHMMKHAELQFRPHQQVILKFPGNMSSMIVKNVDIMPALTESLYISKLGEEDHLVDVLPIEAGISINISTDDEDCEELYESVSGKTTLQESTTKI